ncbi:MotB family protein [Filomicrobium sp.]|uniref:MotB family protein n=1 Tax=Filomicrobium sp. TaxID=2024831 RepID=UPI0025845C47|nr:MotB family protein [Filomicrobium sp.]MCV0371380.1 MotB family protein [Filomicrobium sp.]
MSLGKEDTAAAQIVVIRRRADDHGEGHHGGVWKIAYADFMTAMMAFFLVMWLIASSDQLTREGISNYFNPMQLAEDEPQAKGLSNADKPVDRDPNSKNMNGSQKISASGGAGELKVQQTPTGQDLFQDPYDILERLAQRASSGDETKTEPRADRGPQTTDDHGTAMADGQAFRDPFDPAFRSQRPPARPSDAVGVGGDSVADGGNTMKASDRIAILNEGAGAQAEKAASDNAELATTTQEASRVRDELAAALGRHVSDEKTGEIDTDPASGVKGPTIEVTSDDHGVLISLTDNSNFGMFPIASAEPAVEMVSLMEKVAGILNERRGSLVVRGHTDGRPFRSGTNDNWRLSMARAHIAFHLLTRTGLDEARVERIEGYADRQLKVADDPLASENRRIEIYLRQEAPN